jgi:hypothetical protein
VVQFRRPTTRDLAADPNGVLARTPTIVSSSLTRSLRQSDAVVNEADSEWMANDYCSQIFAETHWRTATECRFDGINSRPLRRPGTTPA